MVKMSKTMGSSWVVAGLAAVLGAGVLCTFAAKGYADGAIVIKNDGACGMPGSDANGNITFGGIGQVTTEVTNNNKVTLKCKGTGITNLSGSGQSFDSFGCGIVDGNGNFDLTTDSHTTISASGVGTLTCTFTF
jgi:hypothetical protein